MGERRSTGARAQGRRVFHDDVGTPLKARGAAILRAANRPVYAMLFNGEARALEEHMPDKWERIETVAGISFWRLSPAP